MSKRNRNLANQFPFSKKPVNADIRRRNTLMKKPRTKERTSPGELHKVQ